MSKETPEVNDPKPPVINPDETQGNATARAKKVKAEKLLSGNYRKRS